MKNYQDMNNEEIKEQLEWSDQHEFSYGYSMWAFKEIERLNNIINELEKDLNKIVALGTITQKQVGLNMLDKLKELKENK